MKTINLLPKAESSELAMELASRQILKFLVIAVGSLLIFLGLAFGIRIPINNEIAENDKQIANLQKELSTSGNLALQRQVVTLNSQMKNITTLTQKRNYWSKALIELGNLSPEGFHLDLASFDRASGQITITGTADNRSSVLNFWSNVKKSTLFKDINFPLNNLEKATDTPFTFSFTVDGALIGKEQ